MHILYQLSLWSSAEDIIQNENMVSKQTKSGSDILICLYIWTFVNSYNYISSSIKKYSQFLYSIQPIEIRVNVVSVVCTLGPSVFA